MTDREKLNKIESYLLEMEKSMSDILADNSRFKIKFDKFDKFEKEITALRKDYNSLSHDFHDFKESAITYSAFEHLIDSMLERTLEISEIRIMTKKHESDIRRVEEKVDNLAVEFSYMKSDVSTLKSDVSTLKSEMIIMNNEIKVGFNLIMQELKNLKKE